MTDNVSTWNITCSICSANTSMYAEKSDQAIDRCVHGCFYLGLTLRLAPLIFIYSRAATEHQGEANQKLNEDAAFGHRDPS